MNNEVILAVGICASVLSAVSMLPQLIKIAKEKKAEAISLPMLSVLLLGLSTWIVYGVMKEDVIIIVSNSISVGLNVATIILSLKYKEDVNLIKA